MTEELQALFVAAEKARAAYNEAEEEYRNAARIAFDTGFTHPDSTHGLHNAARKSAAAQAEYSRVLKKLADHLQSKPPPSG